MSTLREQKLVDILFECVAMTTDQDHDYKFRCMSLEERMAWVAKQLELCGFKTRPVGASWGVLD